MVIHAVPIDPDISEEKREEVEQKREEDEKKRKQEEETREEEEEKREEEEEKTREEEIAEAKKEEKSPEQGEGMEGEVVRHIVRSVTVTASALTLLLTTANSSP